MVCVAGYYLNVSFKCVRKSLKWFTVSLKEPDFLSSQCVSIYWLCIEKFGNMSMSAVSEKACQST